MPVMLPSAELLAQWAAEELWDWKVRALFAAVCVVALLVELAIYLKWGRERQGGDAGRVRRYMGRLSVTMFVVAGAEALFFKEAVSTALLLAVALIVGVIALGMPREGAEGGAAEDGGADGGSRGMPPVSEPACQTTAKE